jgi:uncharacterized protein
MHHQAEQLEMSLRSLKRVVIAFSGGVDSSVVAAAAKQANLDQAVAVTADSASVPQWQLRLARSVALEIGIEHQVVATDEVARADYRRNDRRRCYFCKQTLYQSLSQIASVYPNATIVSGTNADDLGDHRPGIDAGRQSGVVTPLAELGIGKADVRRLARHYGLSNHALPASPCLASRIAYGTEVTAERLKRIEQAEDYLRQFGFEQFRVRLHADELARIEVPKDEILKLIEIDSGGAMSKYFGQIGFKFVSVDLAGFRSGSLNRVLVNIQAGSVRQVTDAGTNLDQNQEAIG